MHSTNAAFFGCQRQLPHQIFSNKPLSKSEICAGHLVSGYQAIPIPVFPGCSFPQHFQNCTLLFVKNFSRLLPHFWLHVNALPLNAVIVFNSADF